MNEDQLARARAQAERWHKLAVEKSSYGARTVLEGNIVDSKSVAQAGPGKGPALSDVGRCADRYNHLDPEPGVYVDGTLVRLANNVVHSVPLAEKIRALEQSRAVLCSSNDVKAVNSVRQIAQGLIRGASRNERRVGDALSTFIAYLGPQSVAPQHVDVAGLLFRIALGTTIIEGGGILVATGPATEIAVTIRGQAFPDSTGLQRFDAPLVLSPPVLGLLAIFLLPMRDQHWRMRDDPTLMPTGSRIAYSGFSKQLWLADAPFPTGPGVATLHNARALCNYFKTLVPPSVWMEALRAVGAAINMYPPLEVKDRERGPTATIKAGVIRSQAWSTWDYRDEGKIVDPPPPSGGTIASTPTVRLGTAASTPTSPAGRRPLDPLPINGDLVPATCAGRWVDVGITPYEGDLETWHGTGTLLDGARTEMAVELKCEVTDSAVDTLCAEVATLNECGSVASWSLQPGQSVDSGFPGRSGRDSLLLIETFDGVNSHSLTFNIPHVNPETVSTGLTRLSRLTLTQLWRRDIGHPICRSGPVSSYPDAFSEELSTDKLMLNYHGLVDGVLAAPSIAIAGLAAFIKGVLIYPPDPASPLFSISQEQQYQYVTHAGRLQHAAQAHVRFACNMDRDSSVRTNLKGDVVMSQLPADLGSSVYNYCYDERSEPWANCRPLESLRLLGAGTPHGGWALIDPEVHPLYSMISQGGGRELPLRCTDRWALDSHFHYLLLLGAGGIDMDRPVVGGHIVVPVLSRPDDPIQFFAAYSLPVATRSATGVIRENSLMLTAVAASVTTGSTKRRALLVA